jgi:aspartokinase
MSNISMIVRNLVKAKPMIYDGLIEGVISHAALAEYLQEDIESELGEKTNLPAIVMAIRRYAETIQDSVKVKKKDFKFNSEIIMKTGLADLTVVKSPACLDKLKKIYSMVNYSKGETLNIIQGNYEITIVISEKHLSKLKELLKGEKILSVETDLVSLSISFSSDFLHTPGILAKVTRMFAWEEINVYENISTMTELIYIINSKDSSRAYGALQKLVSGK